MGAKAKIYNLIVRGGMKVLGTFFPDVHMAKPLKPDERFIEYSFVMSRLPKEKSRILDVGCAGNPFPVLVAGLGHKITGCDIRPYDILNRLTIENLDFVQTDVCKDPFPDASFDLITCISVLEHVGLGGRYGVVDDATADQRIMRQIYKMLKPGGRALITVPYGVAAIFAPYHRVYDYVQTRKLIEGFHLHEEKYFALDANGDWYECTAQEGAKIAGGRDQYSLACFCLEKL